MAWKDWPSWLKGGVIGIVICILFFLYSYNNYQIISKQPYSMPGFAFFLFGIPAAPGIYLLLFFVKLFTIARVSTNFEIFIIFLGGLISWFVYGVIIGWIVGKIKARGNKK